MRYLTAEEVLNVHSVIIDEIGGAHGVRDAHALASLAGLPGQEAFGKELYPGVFTKAAVYVRNIICGYPFVDGNKRTAMACADVFLQLNGYRIAAAEGSVERFALSVISERRSLEDIAAWLKEVSEAA